MADHWTTDDIGDLSGRTALVTGANAGLGLEIARELAAHGARVLMACRNEAKATAAADEIRATHPRGTVEVRPLDLASLASVDALAAQVCRDEPTLDYLINNAGLMAVDHATTEDGFEMQFGVNHLGHFALTAGLMPVLWRTPGSRVVAMSSMGHRMGRLHADDLMFERRGYQRWPAYFQSKLANLLFTAELQRRLGPDAPVQALAAHPGGSSTDLGFEGSSFVNRAMHVVVPATMQPAAVGARPALRAATDPSAKGGEFYGPRFIVRGRRAVRETPSRRARNTADARILWERSEQLTAHTINTDAPHLTS
jgi:NAD(P)-dependent dehydrogenase (short-subunit alcohol dehydrogenase family)